MTALPMVQDDAKTTVMENYRLAWKQRRFVDVLINQKTCEGKIQTGYLSDDVVLSKIFLQLSAQFLHHVIRHVCKEWYLMIRTQCFTHHHVRNSGCGLIIQDRSSASNVIYVEMRLGNLEICKCRMGDLVWSSCNGLILAPDFRELGLISVINPLTKHRTTLPLFCNRTVGYSEFVLAFVEASMEYKVVHKPSGREMQFQVLTIGVDSVWRHINIKNVRLKTGEDLMPSPLATGAYIHWIGTTFVLTFSVENETVGRFPFPQLRKEHGTFLPMGSHLSVIYKSGEILRDVWEMDPKTGEWSMLYKYDYEPRVEHLGSMVPFGWLVAREVLVFSTPDIQTCCMAYNIETREIHWFELDEKERQYHFQPHVNSLVRLEG